MMSWPDGERYLSPLQSLVVFLFLSLVSTLVGLHFLGLEVYCLIKVLGHIGSLDFHEELVLPRHARCVLSLLRCNGHSLLLNSYLSRIGRIENPSCSACGHSSQDISHLFCIVQLRTLCATRSLATLCLFTIWGGPGELPSFWGSMVFRHALIPRKGSGNNKPKPQLHFCKA